MVYLRFPFIVWKDESYMNVAGGDLDKLKVEDCKSYLRKYGLRLTGNKNVLQARIEEHLQFVLCCFLSANSLFPLSLLST